MTDSQRAAFAGVLQRRARLIWGPPGTGKTHFLALAILCLAEAHRRTGSEFRVLVTASTHTAIDNCLRKIAELQVKRPVIEGGLPVGKVNHQELGGMERVALVQDTGAGAWLARAPITVLGGTPWAVRKALSANSVDLVVIDEGSQMKVPEAAIAVQRLRDGGRMLIAGDDRQLPPIVHGVYPDPPKANRCYTGRSSKRCGDATKRRPTRPSCSRTSG